MKQSLGAETSRLKGSIVVIVKNGESRIRPCLESLLRQTVECEIVVVDGNSTDKTREIVQEYGVKLVIAPKQDSYGISRNLGVRSATGDVVLFMDADDYCAEIWAEALLRDFETDPRIGIVAVPREPDVLRGWFLKVLGHEFKRSSSLEAKKDHADWRGVTTKGSAWLKRAILEAGGFDGAMFFGTEDKDLAYRIQRLGYKIVQEPKATIKAAPVGGAWNFLEDKFWRAGVGHGYFRRKHGIYRPSFGGIGSLFLLSLAIALLFLQTWIAPIALVLAVVSLRSLLKEGQMLHSDGVPLVDIVAFLFVKWLSRIAEFVGFVRGYLSFKK